MIDILGFQSGRRVASAGNVGRLVGEATTTALLEAVTVVVMLVVMVVVTEVKKRCPRKTLPASRLVI